MRTIALNIAFDEKEVGIELENGDFFEDGKVGGAIAGCAALHACEALFDLYFIGHL